MKRITLILTILVLLTSACSLTGNDTSQSNDAPLPQNEKRCGDGVCSGPENTQTCPEDCSAGRIIPEEDEDDGTTHEEQSAQQPSGEENETATGYRYVSFGGTIQTALNTAAMGDFTGIAFEYSGDYSVELWFPMGGGEAVQQRNTIALTEFKDLYFDSTSCVWTLDESAFEPVSFNLVASLNLNAIEEGGQTVDELTYQLITAPQAVIGGIVQCEGSPGDFSDPAAIPQMLGWFRQKLVNPIYLNAIETSSAENFAVSPMGFLNIPQETLSYVIVPDLETP